MLLATLFISVFASVHCDGNVCRLDDHPPRQKKPTYTRPRSYSLPPATRPSYRPSTSYTRPRSSSLPPQRLSSSQSRSVNIRLSQNEQLIAFDPTTGATRNIPISSLPATTHQNPARLPLSKGYYAFTMTGCGPCEEFKNTYRGYVTIFNRDDSSAKGPLQQYERKFGKVRSFPRPFQVDINGQMTPWWPSQRTRSNSGLNRLLGG